MRVARRRMEEKYYSFVHYRSQHLVKYSNIYSLILSVLDPRKCEYLKDYSLDFEHAYMTTYLAP